MDRMERPAAESETPTSTPSSQRSTGRLWANIPIDESVDYQMEIDWQDPDSTDEDSHLVKVSENTEKFLKSTFAKPVPNGTRRQWCTEHGVPRVESMKCPKLDKVVKGQLPKEAKVADGEAAKLQTLILDAVGPLAYILEEAQKGSLMVESAVKAAKTALRFLGYASAHVAQNRRRKVLKELNRDLEGLTEDDKEFAEAAPNLFGDGFARKCKEHIENVRALHKTTGKLLRGQFFSREPPLQQLWGRLQEL